MSFKVDNYKDIAIANFADSLKYHNIFERLEDVDVFFKKVGISELINEYKYYLSKTVSDGKYINPNENFVYGLMVLMEKLSSNQEVFYRFILELTNKLEVGFWIDDDYMLKDENIKILESMKRNLAILGYEFSYQYEKDALFDEETVRFKRRILSHGVLNRDEDISFVIGAIKTYNVGIYKSYKEAISKLLITFYSFMSSKGGHKSEDIEITAIESLFCLRILEDILIWHYQIIEKD